MDEAKEPMEDKKAYEKAIFKNIWLNYELIICISKTI